DELFTDYEQKLFTRVVAIAERQGRNVKLLVVPSTNIFDAVAQAAIRLRASEIVVGLSANLSAADQAHLMGEAWDRTARDREQALRHAWSRHDQRPLAARRCGRGAFSNSRRVYTPAHREPHDRRAYVPADCPRRRGDVSTPRGRRHVLRGDVLVQLLFPAAGG